jgi:DNA-binding XRE family transcriptional regulator
MGKEKRLALTNAREKQKLTRGDLAVAVGCSAEHIKSLEYGRVNPSTSLMFKMCNVLKEKPETLFKDVVEN